MATLSLLCRLKLLSFVSVASSNELSRSLLIKSNNENERSPSSSNKSFDDVLDETKGYTCRERRYRSAREGWLVCVAKDVTRYESPGKIMLTINEGKNTFSGTLSTRNICIQKREDSAKRKPNVQRNFLFDKRSSIVSHFPLATIYHAWMFSKDPCPSARYLYSKLSNSKLYSIAYDPTREDLPPGKHSQGSKNPCRMIIPRYENVRSYSSCKKDSKPTKCPTDTSSDEQLPEDACSKTSSEPCDQDLSLKECSESSRPCKPIPDSEPICSTSACPNIKDYCQERESYKEKFWQMLVCFVMLPLLIVTSIFVYQREMEEMKKPRRKYEDVPWMGILHKPFPWGDGKHCFFHNPVKNPVPGEGYEVEDPNAPKETAPEEGKEN